MKLLPVIFFSLLGSFATAQDAQPREAGLTGTGIYGIITELGSFYVNGQRITYPEHATAQSVLGAFPAHDLRPGDTIAAQVSLIDGGWVAHELREIHPIIGPVSEINDQRLIIMGTVIDLSGVGPTRIEVGEWVAVNGLWRVDQVIATHVSKIEPQENAHILGSFLGLEDDQSFHIGGTIVRGIVPQHASVGDVLRIAGTPMRSSIVANTMTLGLFDKSLGRILAQGYLSHPDQDGQYTLLGSGMTAFTDRPEMINVDILATYCGLGSELSEAVFVESNDRTIFECGANQ